MAEYHLAELNIAKMKYPLEDPRMQEFVDRLDQINALAEASPGFVWRLQTDEGNAAAIDYFGAGYLVNMSVWRDVASLQDYAFRSAHRGVFARRQEWFESMDEDYLVLWWIPAGSIPTVEEAGERLEHLRQIGPSAHAFTFRQKFAAPD